MEMDWKRGLIAVTAVSVALAGGACRERGTAGEAAFLDGEPPPVAAVQALLSRQRLYTGPVDGVANEATAAAIRRYQIVHGMRASGRLDAPTLHAMLGPAPPPGRALIAADLDVLRELSEAPPPEAVAEHRQAIPALPPPPPTATPSPTPRRGSASKAGRSRAVRHSRAVTPVE